MINLKGSVYYLINTVENIKIHLKNRQYDILSKKKYYD